MPVNYPSLTAVLHELVKRAPSGLTARSVADLLGRDYNTLMSELSGQPGHKLGADLLLPLMELTGSDAPLNFLARERGGVFVPVRPDNSAVDLAPAILASVKEFGDYAAEVARDVIDSNFSASAQDAPSRAAGAQQGPRSLQATASVRQDGGPSVITEAQLARILKEGQEAATAIVTLMELARAVHQRQFPHGSLRESPGGQ